MAGGSSVAINNSILFANNGPAIDVTNGSATATYSIVDGGYAGTGNLDTIPLFVNPGSGDFHLQWASPAIDAGDPATDVDLDGTLADMGAFPYDQSQQPPDSPYNVVTVPGNGQATISWSPPVDPRGNENDDIISYVLYQGLTADNLTVRDTLAVPDTSYTDTGTEDYMQNGITYYYEVTAIDTGGLVSAASNTVSVIPEGGTLVLADTTHAFGQVFFDSTATWDQVLTNSGNGILNISSITNATELFTLSQQSVQIAAGASETIQVTYHPDLTSGTVSDTITITSDDLYLPLSNVSLSAESVWPVIGLSTTSADYGSVPINTESSLVMKVYNTGLGDLNLSSIYVDDTDHFTVNTGGRMLPGSIISNAKILLDMPVVGGSSADSPKSKDETSLTDTWETENFEVGSFTKSSILDLIVSAGDILELTINFMSPDTGIYTTDLHIASNDPLGNDNLTVSHTAHAVKAEISVVNTMSVVTYVNNNISFDMLVTNSGGYQLDYILTESANYAGFEWLAIPQASGSVAAYSSANAAVNIVSTADLDADGYNGYLYFNSNTGANPQQMENNDTVEVYLALLDDNTQISTGSASVPSGNAQPINVLDDAGTDMGLMLDFTNSQGGTVNATRIDAHPPADSFTPFIDADGSVTDPIYARRYYEISSDISGSFFVDIGFDYATLAGILDPSALRLAKRTLNAGTGEEWTIIPTANTTLNETDGLVIATGQTAFSQWTMVSNVGENTFVDMQAPTVVSTSVSPNPPVILTEITVSATINDESDIASALLYYTSGGNSVFTDSAMSGSGSSWSAVIPGGDVTRNGSIYYISAADLLGYSAVSDSFGVEVSFPSGDLTTSNATGSVFTSGFPLDKWRMLGVPADLTSSTVADVLADELGTQTNTTWRLFGYNATTESFNDNPSNFTMGESYWIYQRVQDNLIIDAPAGQTGSMGGTTWTIDPGKWSMISSPYPFPVDIDLDQIQFYGPITYGLTSEAWTNVQTELKPWSGYAIYIRTGSALTFGIDPIVSTTGTLVAKQEEDYGWIVNLNVQSGDYADVFNRFGQLNTAVNELDYHDNPELLPPGDYISLTFEQELYPDQMFTSDVRGLDELINVWNIEIAGNGLDHNAQLSWVEELPMTDEMALRIVDLNSKTVVDGQQEDQLSLGLINKHFPRKLHAIVGPPDLVDDIAKELLAAIPEEFVLHNNYPNPFNPVTNIKFGLPEPKNVRLTIVNILGQEVTEITNGWHDIGYHKYRWNAQNQYGNNVAAGMYFAVLTDGKSVLVRKLLLLK